MSQRLVTGNLARQLATATRAAAATTPRTFTTAVQQRRSATEAVGDTLKKADRAVSDKIVDGINAGSKITEKLKEGVGDVASGKTSGQAAKIRAEAEGKAHELAGEAKETAGEVKGKAKEAADEAKGKVKEMT